MPPKKPKTTTRGNTDIRPIVSAAQKKEEDAKPLYAWLKWITYSNFSLTAVEDPIHRDMFQYRQPISHVTIVAVFHQVVAVVQRRIREELELVQAASQKATLSYCSWTSEEHDREHYLGVFLSYLRPDRNHAIVLLACSRMTLWREGDVDDFDRLNADERAMMINGLLSRKYGIDIEKGFIAHQMMEHSTVNEMAGKYLELPTVAHLHFRDSCEPAYEDEEEDLISAAAEATAVVLVPRDMPNVEFWMEPAAAVARQWHLVRRALARYTILRYEYSEHHEEHEEDLIFLKMNRRFWNEATVREALGKL